MKKITLCAVLLSVSVLSIVSCKKSNETNTQKAIENVKEIKVPEGFGWASSRTVSFTASVTDERFADALHKISIYDGDPYSGGNMLAEGSAKTSAAFAVSISLPNTLTDVYVVKTSPDNSQIISKITVTSAAIALTFGAKDPSVAFTMKQAAKTTADCSSGCTNTITTNTSNLNVNTGDVVCVTGNNITVGFSSFNGGTVRVCGANVTLQNCNLNGNATLLISNSGRATASSINFNSSSATIQNDGTLTINGSFADNGIFTNNGTFTSTGDFNINSGAAAFVNGGTMNVGANFNNGGPTSAVNNGSIIVAGAFQQNSGAAVFVNNCNLRVTGNYNQNSQVKNYNYIKVGSRLTINSGTELSLYNGAMVSTNGFTSNSPVKGYGSTSLLKITGSLTLNTGGGVAGAVQVSSVSSFSTSFLSLGATLGNSVYIPATGCNSEGNGTSTTADSDGDGVSDALDAYPADPAKAYNNYYPSASGSATVAFEDQWPSTADYDLNDLVMGYQYKVVTNAANTVVQVVGNYSLYATGGDFSNGFAVQFPLESDKMAGLTGGNRQNGQTYAVVELFPNMRNEMSAWNTVPGAATAATKNYTVSFNVTSGPSLSSFGLSGYNPFIWHTYGQEIHLPGHAPTDWATTSLFGTADDNTSVSASRYYVTRTGLPFALDVPVMPFKYPVEKTDITRAYLHFADWAQSGGSLFADWYGNTASSYRNTANIYNN